MNSITAIGPAKKLIGWEKTEIRALLTWIFTWVFLSNACFIALWFVGSPPRYGEILVIAILGMIVNRSSFMIRYLYFTAAMLWTTLNFVADVFNLDLPRLLASLKFMLSINLASSPVYVLATLGIVGVLTGAYFTMRRDSRIMRWWYYPIALFAALGVATVDYTLSSELRGHYKRAPAAGTPFSSAMEQSDMPARANGQRHLVLIMVESLGQPVNNTEMQRLLFEQYRKSDAVLSRYELSSGTTPFFGSTTRGEIREMCGRWGEYFPLMAKPDNRCLPNQLAQQGYETMAMHSFNGVFFDRSKWYPNIGFQKSYFADDLIKKGASKCGGVFPGACDRDVPKLMSDALRAAEKPTFLYWLTVNSHLPVLAGHNLNVEKCQRVSVELAENYPHICSQYAVWNDIDQAIISQITASDFPEADILLVSDHMPPFFDRHHRKQIDPANVPWLYLKRK
ncbi:MAG: sulfatase-like hydrolase/transferase [Parasphingorhabdus sp.]